MPRYTHTYKHAYTNIHTGAHRKINPERSNVPYPGNDILVHQWPFGRHLKENPETRTPNPS